MRTVPADSRLSHFEGESIFPASKIRQSQVNVLRQGHPQASVLSESKPEAPDEVSTATPRTSESVPWQSTFICDCREL